MLHRPLLLATLLAAVAGWVDALGFFALAGVFTAHLTGNLVLISEELLQGEGDLVPKLLVFPAFTAGVVLSGLAHRALEARGRSSVRVLLLAEAAAVAGFMVAGLLARPIAPHQVEHGLPLLAILLGAVAMGVQNAQGRLALRQLGSTAVMTTNITQLILDATDLVCAPAPRRLQAARRTHRQLMPVLGFVLAAIAAAFAYGALSFWALLLPIGALCVLAWLSP